MTESMDYRKGLLGYLRGKPVYHYEEIIDYMLPQQPERSAMMGWTPFKFKEFYTTHTTAVPLSNWNPLAWTENIEWASQVDIPADWRCSYCGLMNGYSHNRCDGCNAPRR